MSQTNRALNRILLALAGLALLAAGASTAGILPDIAALWAAAGSSLADRAGSLLAAAPLPGPARNWRPVAGVAAPVLTAALGIAWLASQGGGRTSRVARETDGGLGTTVVATGLVSAAGKHALDGRPPWSSAPRSRPGKPRAKPDFGCNYRHGRELPPGRSRTPPTNWSGGSTHCWAIRCRFWSESPVAPGPGWLDPAGPDDRIDALHCRFTE